VSEPTPFTALPAWRQGSVASTGGSRQVAVLQRRLATFPNQVRPLGRGDDLTAAFADGEVVIHLAGTLQPGEPNSYTAANLGSVQATVAGYRDRPGRLPGATGGLLELPRRRPPLAQPVSAGHGAGRGGPARQRDPGHHPALPPHLRAAREPGPTARSFLTGNGRSVTILGRGSQRLAPVYREDVVETIVHVGLDAAAPVGTFELAGPRP
jgi:hypothetical protein